MAGTKKASNVTKSGADVLKILKNNAVIDASQSGGTVNIAEKTDGQTAIENLVTNYQVQAIKANADSDLLYSSSLATETETSDSAKTATGELLTSGTVSSDLAYTNYLTENRPSGAYTYAQYLASMGGSVTDSEKTRASSIAEANAEYEKSVPTYGQAGEQLARLGLGNSGYADYLTATADTTKKTAKLTADATKIATDSIYQSGYEQYLQNYQESLKNETNSQVSELTTRVNTLYSSLVDEDGGMSYTPAQKSEYEAEWKESGYSDEEIAYALNALDSTYNYYIKENYEAYKKAIGDDATMQRIGVAYYGTDGWNSMSASQKSTAIDQIIANDSTLTDDQKAEWFVEELDAKVAGGQNVKDIMNELLSLQGAGMTKSTYEKIEQTIAEKYISYKGGAYYFNGKEVEWSGTKAGSYDVVGDTGYPAGKRRFNKYKAEINVAQLEEGKIYYNQQEDWFCIYMKGGEHEYILRVYPDLGTQDSAYGKDADESILAGMLKSYALNMQNQISAESTVTEDVRSINSTSRVVQQYTGGLANIKKDYVVTPEQNFSDVAKEETKTDKSFWGKVKYVGGRTVAGFAGVFEGVGKLANTTVAVASGDKRMAKYYAKKSSVGEWKADMEEKYTPGVVLSFIGDAMEGVGQSTVLMADSSGAPIGSILFFAGIMGNSLGDAVEMTDEVGFKEYAYAALSASAEYALEKASAGIFKAGGRVSSAATGKIAGTVFGNTAKKVLEKRVIKAVVSNAVVKNIVHEGVGEFIEESLGELVDFGLKRATQVDPNATTSVRQVLYSGFVGFASGGIMSGSSIAISKTASAQRGKKIAKAGNADTLIRTAQVVLDEAKATDGFIDDYGLMDSLEKSLDAYKKAKNKTGNTACTALGEIQMYTAYIEKNTYVSDARAKIINAPDSTLQSYMDMVNESGENVTIEDIRADKDKVATRLAMRQWVNNALTINEDIANEARISAEMKRMESGQGMSKETKASLNEAQFNDMPSILDAERAFNPDSDGLQAWKLGDEKDTRAYLQKATDADGKVIDGMYEFGYIDRDGYTHPDMDFIDLATAKSMYETYQQVAKNSTAEAQNTATQTAEAKTDSQATAKTEQAPQTAETVAEKTAEKAEEKAEEKVQSGSTEKQDANRKARERLQEKLGRKKTSKKAVTDTQSQSKEESKAENANDANNANITDGRNDSATDGNNGHPDNNTPAGKEEVKTDTKADEKRSESTDKKTDTKAEEKTEGKADEKSDEKSGEKTKKKPYKISKKMHTKLSKWIDGYFALSYSDRARIARTVEDAEAKGVDEKTQKSIAVAMLTREGLDVRFSEKISANGALTVFKETNGKRRLMVLNPNSTKSLEQTFLHEFLHDLTSDPTTDPKKLFALTRAFVGKENFDNYITDHKDAYFDMYAKTDKNFIRTESEDGKVTRKFASKETEDFFKYTMLEEATAELGSRMLYNRDFLKRLELSQKGKFRRALSRMAKWVSDAKSRNLLTGRRMEKYLKRIMNQTFYSLNEHRKASSEGGELFDPKREDPNESLYRATVSEFGDVKFSLQYAENIAQKQQEYLNKMLKRNEAEGITMDDLAKAQSDITEMVALMMDHVDMLPQDKIGETITVNGKKKKQTTVVSNGSYDYSIENTTICMRTLAYNSFVDKVAEKLGRPLSQMESFLVSQKLYDIATDPQCLYCYVSLDRKAYTDYLLKYMKSRDDAIEAYKKAGMPDLKRPTAKNVKDGSLYGQWLNGRENTEKAWETYSLFMRMAKKGITPISAEDVATDAKRKKISLEGGIIGEQAKNMLAYAQSASYAKKQTDYIAYFSEILKMRKSVVDNLNRHYGLRFYSFSDYTPAFIVENMQQITDASLKGFKGLAYTKDVDFAEIFAPTGININISVFVKKQADGTYAIDERQSAKLADAIRVRNKYENVGIVAVATDRAGVEWALAQEWTDVVIPFHTVKTGQDVAEFYKWTIFTKDQNDNIADKNLWQAYVDSVAKTDAQKEKVSKMVYPSEHNNDRETFLRLCKERGLKPRFESFLSNPNYMKLVNETRRSAKDTPAMKPVFDLDAAKRSYKKFVEKGGYFEGWYKDGVDVEKEVNTVAEDVKAGKKANEVDYGRQDIAEVMATSEEQRRKNRQHGGGNPTVYSLRDDTVVIDTDQNIFEGVDRKDYGKVARDYMRKQFRGKIINDTAITRLSEDEYTSSKYTQWVKGKNNGVYDTKMRASTELDNMLKVAKFLRHEDAVHPHKYNGKGYDRYSVRFELNGEPFTGELLVAIDNNDRRVLYDVVSIKRTDNPVSEASIGKANRKSERGTIGSDTDIVPQKNDVVKRENEKSSENITKYSLAIGNESVLVDVQEEKDLIAIHNLTEKNLLDTLNLGGFPMPSIAVVKAEQGHTNYGNISVVFGRDTIDPKLSYDNKIYGSDAWTPTASNARVEYRINNKKMRAFQSRMEQLSKKTADGIFSSGTLVERTGVDDVSSQSASELAERIANTDEAHSAYLADKGITIEPEYRKKEYDSFGNEALQTYIDSVGKEHLESVIERSESEYTDAFKTEEEKVRSIMWEHYFTPFYEMLKKSKRMKDKTAQEVLEMAKRHADACMENNVTIFRVENFVKKAWEYLQNGATVTEEIDRMATSEKIRQAVSNREVAEWLEPQISEFFGKAGISNGKDAYTASGNRKSFAETHYAYNAENIVRAMRETAPARGAGTFGANGSTLVATATPIYDSIDSMKADKGRLKTEEKSLYDSIMSDIDEKLNAVEKDIMRTTKHHTDDFYEETQIIGGIIVESASGERTVKAVQMAFAKEDYKISEVQAKKILDLYEQVAQVPTGYFEAKPERVVDFSEIKMVELPQSASDSLKKQLAERNIPYEVYGSTDEERTQAVQNLENVRFSLKDSDVPKVTISENIELSRRIRESSKSKYDAIREYLVDLFGGETFIMSDGVTAIMDKRDAKELSHNANNEKTVQLGNLRKIIESAKFSHIAPNVTHNKFTAFRYYAVTVVYKNTDYNLWVNVGVGKYDNQNHIYSLTNREEAPIHYDVSQPVGSAIQNASSDNSIHQNGENVKRENENNLRFSLPEVASTAEKSSEKAEKSDSDKIASETRFTAGQYRKNVANHSQAKVYSRGDAEATVDRITSTIVDNAFEMLGYGSEDLGIDSPTVEIKGKSRDEVVSYLFEKLNQCQDGKRLPVAEKVADYIIAHALVKDNGNPDLLATAEMYYNGLGQYRKKLSLGWMSSDIRYMTDKGYQSAIARWRTQSRKAFGGMGAIIDDGISPLTAMEEFLRSQRGRGMDADIATVGELDYVMGGIINDQDAFSWIREKFEWAEAVLSDYTESVTMASIGSKAELYEARKKIANEVLDAFENKGVESDYARRQAEQKESTEKRIERQKEYFTKRADAMEERMQKFLEKHRKKLDSARKRAMSEARLYRSGAWLEELVKRDRKANNLLSDERMRKIAETAVRIAKPRNARKPSVVKSWAESLSKIYRPDNQLLSVYGEVDTDANGTYSATYYDANVGEALQRLTEIVPNIEVKDGKTIERSLLTDEQIVDLETVVSGITRLYRTYDTVFLDGKRVSLTETAKSGVENMQWVNETKKSKKGERGKVGEALDTAKSAVNSYLISVTNPLSTVRSFERHQPNGVLSQAYEAIVYGQVQAQTMFAELMQPFEDFYRENKGYRKKLARETVTYHGVTMTKAQAISLYCTLKQEHAKLGMKTFGIAFEDRRGNYTQSGAIKDYNAEEFAKNFDETDKKFISQVETFFNETSKAVKSDTDMRVIGSTNVSDDYYFPIRRDQKQRRNSYANSGKSMVDSLQTVINLAFNKNRVNKADGRLAISDVTSIIMNHAQGLATYEHLYEQIQTFDRLLNKRVGEVDGEGNIIKETQTSLAEQIEIGNNGAIKYFQKLMADIQGVSTEVKDGLGEWLNKGYGKVQGLYAQAMISGNLKTAILPLCSYFATFRYLDAKHLAKGTAMNATPNAIKANLKQMDTYSTVAKGRFYEKGAIRSQTVQDQVNSIVAVTGSGIEFTERFMFSKVWNACKSQTAEQTGFDIESDENCKEAGKLFDKVVIETQSQYVASMKSPMARSSNNFVRGLTMFRSDGVAMLSNAIDSIRAYFDLSARQEAGQNVGTELKRAKGQVGRAVASVASVCVAVAIVTQLMRYVLNTDDDDEETPAKNIALNTVDSAMGMFPLIGDVYSVFAEGYDISNMTINGLNDVIEAIKGVFALADESDLTDAEVARSVRKLIYGVGHMVGVPARNLTNLATGVIRRINKPSVYAYDSVFDGEKYAEDLQKAVKNGDTKMAEAIAKVMYRRKKGTSYSQETLDEVLRLYKKGYDGVLPNGVPSGYTKTQTKAFRTTYAGADKSVQALIESTAYKGFTDEQKAKAVKSVYATWKAYAEYKATGATEDKSAVMSEVLGADAFAKARAYLTGLKAGEANKSGDPWRTVISKGLKDMGYTSDEISLILYSAGYKTDSDTEKFVKIINKKGLTDEQLTTLASVYKLTVKNGKLTVKASEEE